MWVPCASPVTVVVAEDGEVIVPASVETFVHAYVVIVPPVSIPVPERVTDDVGRVMVWSVPAFAVGGVLVGGGVEPRDLLNNHS